MSDHRPIGVFDSGSGGLTVARAVLDLLPAEPILYVGDTKRFPYGPRPLEEIRGYALEIAAYLVDRGVKMLVVACNSIEVAAIQKQLQRRAANSTGRKNGIQRWARGLGEHGQTCQEHRN